MCSSRDQHRGDDRDDPPFEDDVEQAACGATRGDEARDEDAGVNHDPTRRSGHEAARRSARIVSSSL